MPAERPPDDEAPGEPAGPTSVHISASTGVVVGDKNHVEIFTVDSPAGRIVAGLDEASWLRDFTRLPLLDRAKALHPFDEKALVLLWKYARAYPDFVDLLRIMPAASTATMLHSMNPGQRDRTVGLVRERLRGTDDPRADVDYWARADPGFASRVLIAMGAGGEPLRRLLPGGAAFLLSVPPANAAELMVRLLPVPEHFRPVRAATASEIEAAVSALIARDPVRTVRFMVRPVRPHGAPIAAAYLRRLRLSSGVPLMTSILEHAAEDQRRRVRETLPRFAAVPLYRAVAARTPPPAALGEWPDPSTSWPWIDVAMSLLGSAPAACSRLTSEGFGAAAGAERANARAIWQRTRRGARTAQYYRRQRNHLAVLVAILTTVLIIVSVSAP